jgi:hypothetical protein
MIICHHLPIADKAGKTNLDLQIPADKQSWRGSAILIAAVV